MPGNEHFDHAAATWDLEDRRVALAHALAQAIAVRVPLAKGHSVLDFGCGTGLVTLELAPRSLRSPGPTPRRPCCWPWRARPRRWGFP